MTFRPLLSGLRICPLIRYFSALASIVLLSLLLAAGCHRAVAPPADVVIVHEITPKPVRVGLMTVALGLTDHSSKPVTAAHITLEADMSHPGMAPVFADTAEVAPGRYQGSLNLNMPGDWAVLVHVRMPNGERVDQQIDVRGVESN